MDYKRISFMCLLLYVLWYDNVISLMMAMLQRVPMVGMFLSDAFGVIIATIAVLFILINNHKENFIFITFVIFSTLLSFLLSEETFVAEWYSKYLIRCISAFNVGLLYFKYQNKNFVVKASAIAVLSSILYTMYYINVNKTIDYNSADSYLVLACALITIYHALEETSVFSLVFALLGAIYLVAFGSRGPLVAIVVLAIMYVLMEKNQKKKLRVIIPICIILVLIVVFFDNIYDLFQNAGLSTRIFDVFKRGNDIYYDNDFSNGRTEVLKNCIEKINKSPIFGYGFLGDTHVATGGRFTSYPHNFLFELLIQFGYPLGSIIFIVILVLLLKQFIKKEHIQFINKHYYLISSLFCSSFVILLFSLSYLRMPDFFMLIGLCIAINKEVRKNNSMRMNAIP